MARTGATKVVVKKHFVTFYSPGTFFAEDTTRPIDAWDVDTAVQMARDIVERYGARPYAFEFSTCGRGAKDLNSRTLATSKRYYLGGRVLTLAEVEARNDPADEILIRNMRGNGYERVIQSVKGWRWTQPFEDGDERLDVDIFPAEQTTEASL